MTTNVIQLNRAPSKIAHYLRLGQGCHRQLEELQDSGDLPYERFVIDAARLKEQKDLLGALLKDGKEVVLDPNFAELSTPGGAASQAKNLAWANPRGFWRPEDMNDARLTKVAEQIADAGLEAGCSAIHTPSHMLSGVSDPWLNIDIRAAEKLRMALDTQGGKDIDVDYVLSLKYASLRDPEERQVIANSLSEIPFNNLWLRVPKFGVTATGAMVRQYISAVNHLLLMIGRRAIIADCAGGLVPLAACAFGSIGGVSHGVGEKESFDPSPWYKPRTGPFMGRARRVYIPALDTYFLESQFDELWSLPGARSTLICRDPSCCSRGVRNMKEKGHVLYQRATQVNELSAVPELSRPEHLVYRQLEPVGQSTRSLARLRGLKKHPEIQRKVQKHADRLDRVSKNLRELMELRAILERSKVPPYRASAFAGR